MCTLHGFALWKTWRMMDTLAASKMCTQMCVRSLTTRSLSGTGWCAHLVFHIAFKVGDTGGT